MLSTLSVSSLSGTASHLFAWAITYLLIAFFPLDSLTSNFRGTESPAATTGTLSFVANVSSD